MPYAELLKGRTSIVGQYYIVTTVTYQRARILHSLQLGRCILNTIRAMDDDRYCETLACVVMPDHVHWLLCLRGPLALSELVRRFKGLSAQRINQIASRTGALWQKGFHDHAVRSDESLAAIARYVIENPVRAGLATAIGHYSQWHCVWDLS